MQCSAYYSTKDAACEFQRVSGGTQRRVAELAGRVVSLAGEQNASLFQLDTRAAPARTEARRRRRHALLLCDVTPHTRRRHQRRCRQIGKL